MKPRKVLPPPPPATDGTPPAQELPLEAKALGVGCLLVIYAVMAFFLFFLWNLLGKL